MMNKTPMIKKRRLLPVLLSFVAMGMMAVPAKRVKKTLVLADGTTVEAVLTGDENVHYYTAADGRKYVPSADKNVFRLAEDAELEQRRMTRADAREQLLDRLRGVRLTAHDLRQALDGCDMGQMILNLTSEQLITLLTT